MNKLIKIYFSKICYNQGQKLTRMAEEKLWLTATAHCGHYVSASVPAVARSTSGSWVASWPRHIRASDVSKTVVIYDVYYWAHNCFSIV